MARSNDDTNYSTSIELSNTMFIGSVQVNATTAVRKFFRIEQVPAYFKIIAVNSHATIDLGASGNTIQYRGVDLSNA